MLEIRPKHGTESDLILMINAARPVIVGLSQDEKKVMHKAAEKAREYGMSDVEAGYVGLAAAFFYLDVNNYNLFCENIEPFYGLLSEYGKKFIKGVLRKISVEKNIKEHEGLCSLISKAILENKDPSPESFQSSCFANGFYTETPYIIQ